jgi:hypothetical protein
MATAALIIAALSALAGVVAAVHAKRSADAANRSADAADRSADAADRSAAAEERAATVAEHALELERERSAAERRVRDEGRAPRVDAGAMSGNVWVLEQQGNRLAGLVHNHGPGVALIERIELLPQDGLEPVPYHAESDEPYLLSPNDGMPVEFDWPHARQPVHEPITLSVTFQAGDFDYRASALFKLRRRGGDHVGQPLWMPAEAKLTRL